MINETFGDGSERAILVESAGIVGETARGRTEIDRRFRQEPDTGHQDARREARVSEG